MQKKYGIDEYGIFLIWMAVIAIGVGYFIKSSFLNYLSIFILFYALFRSISTNIVRRSIENQSFINNVINPIKAIFTKNKAGKKTTKDDGFKYISCPNCHQKLRIPKDKGKIKVRCPKCREKFDAES